MGRIAKMIKTEIENFIVQTVEMYFGANVTAETFAPSGDDSPPLPDDRIVLVQTDGTNNFVAVGVLSVSQGAKPGEKILYSRDENGEVKAVIKLLNDGSIQMQTFGDAGINFTDKAGNVIETSSGGIKLTDKNGNVIEEDSDGITLTDKNGGKVTMAGKITLEGQSGKVEVS